MIFLRRFKQPLALSLATALLAAVLLAGCGNTVDDPTTTGVASDTRTAAYTETVGDGISISYSVPTQTDTTEASVTESATRTVVESRTKKDNTPANASPQSAQVLKYVEQVQDILNSKNFTLKGNGSLGSGTASAVTLAASGDKTAIEFPTAMLSQLSGEMGIGDLSGLESVVGETSRLVVSPGRALLVFPRISNYVDVSDEAGDMQLGEIDNLTEYLGGSDVLKNVKTSTAKLNGKEHQVATIADDSGKSIARLYFLEGQLRRIEPLGDAKGTIPALDVTSLSGTTGSRFFETDNLLPLDLKSMQSILDGLGRDLNLPSLPSLR